jgi:hypothetical protein
VVFVPVGIAAVDVVVALATLVPLRRVVESSGRVPESTVTVGEDEVVLPAILPLALTSIDPYLVSTTEPDVIVDV